MAVQVSIANPKTFQTEIMERFMNSSEIEKLGEKYRSHRKAMGEKDRSKNFSEVLTDEQKAQLKSYIQDTDISSKELAQSWGIKPNSLRVRMARQAFKFLFQNQKMLK